MVETKVPPLQVLAHHNSIHLLLKFHCNIKQFSQRICIPRLKCFYLKRRRFPLQRWRVRTLKSCFSSESRRRTSRTSTTKSYSTRWTKHSTVIVSTGWRDVRSHGESMQRRSARRQFSAKESLRFSLMHRNGYSNGLAASVEWSSTSKTPGILTTISLRSISRKRKKDTSLQCYMEKSGKTKKSGLFTMTNTQR